MRKIIPLLLLFSSFLWFSCDDETPIQIIYEVPDEVEPIVQKFIGEAKDHGIDLEVNNLIVELTTPVQNGGQFVCGVTFGEIINITQNRIELDTQCLAWRHSDVSREVLVYHELGHALLLRHHRTDKLPNFDFASMMFGSSWNIDDFYIFDLTKRDYYIDELFDPTTPVPAWAE